MEPLTLMQKTRPDSVPYMSALRALARHDLGGFGALECMQRCGEIGEEEYRQRKLARSG